MPIRLAGLKAHEPELPALPREGYRLAVYGVPGSFPGNPKKLGDPLRDQAFLRREGKKDVKPSRVEVFQRGDGMVVAYLFPPSAEISLKDRQVEFEAHIGRIVVAQAFNVVEMMYMGKLEI